MTFDKRERKRLKNWIAQNPEKFGGNVQLMEANINFSITKELKRLRRETRKCKLDYKV